MLQLKLASPSS